jgi:hypothetical protein
MSHGGGIRQAFSLGLPQATAKVGNVNAAMPIKQNSKISAFFMITPPLGASEVI